MFQVENRLNCPWRGPGQHFTVKISYNQPPHPPPNPHDKLLVNPLTQLVTNYIKNNVHILNN